MARKNYGPNMPTFDKLIKPTIQALIELGGSGAIEEINNKVYELAKFPEEILQVSHGDGGTYNNEIDYRLAWCRSNLKKIGILENSSRGIWALSKAIDLNNINTDEINRKYTEQLKLPKQKKVLDTTEPFEEEIEEGEEWKEKLLNILYDISPTAFERLTQRLLRESGFFQVEVTPQTGDGGIDGKGILKVGGLLSFHIIFQCKRYRGSVTSNQIRDFRGAMQGRTDKGLFITTGVFTRDAIKEATRDGAPPIDLIDGELLCDKLKELKLGVDTKMTETIEIKNEWFKNL
jgi:restriction system protein